MAHPERVPITRRAFLRGSAIAGLGGGLGAVALHEAGDLTLERVTARLPRLPTALEGFRIAVLSDFHLHPFTHIGLIKRAVQLANTLQPDLTVLLGDYVDATVDAIHELAPELGRLNARLGVFGVLGNHDYWKGAAQVRRGLAGAGITILVDSGLTLGAGASELFLAGLDSAICAHPNLNSALRARPTGTPTIALIHEPDYADVVARDPRVALQLSGHSHGGQVRLPRIGAIKLPRYGAKYDQGLYRVQDLVLYTNRGIGLADVPLRLNCPPEVTEVTLAAA